jgi:hypothetical protein
MGDGFIQPVIDANTATYLTDEVVWSALFADVFNRPADEGLLTVDVRRLHSIESVNAE